MRELRFPSRSGPILPALRALHDALPHGSEALVTDVVWQTAPTPALAHVLAPSNGGEKVRPIEGYEMQLDHVGLEIVSRSDEPVEPLLRGVPNERRAARVCTWRVRRVASDASTDEPQA